MGLINQNFLSSRLNLGQSTTPTCPACKKVIPGEDVNVATDVAYCRACNISYKLSDLTSGAILDPAVDLGKPPPGAWYRSSGLNQWLGATHRSLGTAAGALAISLFWNGIVSVFVCLALSATLHNLGIPVPSWFPAPIMNKSPIGIGFNIFLWLFLTPFILIGLAMLAAFFGSLGGRSELQLEGSNATLVTGLGFLSRKNRFTISDVKDVRLELNQWRDSDGGRQRKTNIIIETRSGKPIKFGSMLTDERRTFLAAGARKLLLK